MMVETEEIKSLRKKFNQLDKEKLKVGKELSKVWKIEGEKETDKLFKGGLEITPETIMALDYLSHPGTEKYYTKIREKILSYPGVYPSGNGVFLVNNKNNQRSQMLLEVMFDQNKPFKEQLGILTFVPFLKPVTLNSNKSDLKQLKVADKTIGVFEAGCKEKGVVELLLKENNWKVVITRYRKEEELFSNKDITKSLEFIYAHFPFRRKLELK